MPTPYYIQYILSVNWQNVPEVNVLVVPCTLMVLLPPSISLCPGLSTFKIRGAETMRRALDAALNYGYRLFGKDMVRRMVQHFQTHKVF